MSKEKKKPTNQTWDELPKSRVIRMENVSAGTTSDNQNVLLKSLTSDFQLSNGASQLNALFIFRSVSENFLSFYAETERGISSPWKGMHSYIPANRIHQTDPESKHPLTWLLTRLSIDPKLITAAGVILRYACLPDNYFRVDFYLQHEKIFNSILDYLPKLPLIFKQKGQLVLRAIIEEDKMESEINVLTEGNSELDKQLRAGDLDFDQLFELCKRYKNKYLDPVPDYKIDVANLNFQLMPYQRDTVRWMMHREAEGTVDENLSWMFKHEKLPTDPSVFYYPSVGAITRNQLNESEHYETAKRFTLKGGILADEMGLGKTVQVLSLVSSNRKGGILKIEDGLVEDKTIKIDGPVSTYSIVDQIRIAELSFAEMNNAKNCSTLMAFNVCEESEGNTINCTTCAEICSASICGWDFKEYKNETFYCPECLTKMGQRRPIKTTLIIVPESLIFQWFTEIAKHCSDNFKVMFYFGVKKHGYLQPFEMEKYDVILTTYDTLRKEIIFTDQKLPRRNLRNDWSPLHLTSSLIHVNFWRVIVDESQVMPQKTNSNLSQMLLKIHGENWWCVTGTPLVRTIADMSPLFSFLALFPFNNYEFFSQYVHPQYLNFVFLLREQKKPIDEQNLPHILLLEILARIMSRKTKRDVDLQIKLPTLTQEEKRICFSEIEQRQYKEEKERLRDSVEKAIGRAKNTSYLSELACRDKVLQKLRTLRDTILTGQNSSSDFGYAGFTYAPETVVFQLVHNKKLTIENHIRSFIASAMGLAGVQFLMGEPGNALAIYEHALSKFEEIIETTCMKDVLGPDIWARFNEVASRSNSPRPIEVDEYLEEEETLDEGTQTENETERIRQTTGNMRIVQQICRKYAKNTSSPVESSGKLKKLEQREKEVEYSKDTEELVGPSEPKKARLEIGHKEAETKSTEENNEEKFEKEKSIPINYDDIEESEKIERQKHTLKMSLKAFQSLRMDGLQEFHLIINMYKVQKALGIPEVERLSLDRLDHAFKRCTSLQKEAIETIRTDLPVLSDIFANDEKNMMHQIGEFFEMLRARCAVHQDTSALYRNGNDVLPSVKRDFFSKLPYLALYDSERAEPNGCSHWERTCMGSCSKDEPLDCIKFFEKSQCMPLEGIITKTMDQITKIDSKRIQIEQKVMQLIELISEMSEPSILLDLLDKSSKTNTTRRGTMHTILSCEHTFYDGVFETREDMIVHYKLPYRCDLCDAWCKLHSLFFDSGFMNYHASDFRARSGVFDFATFLVNHYSPTKKAAMRFLKNYLRPYFDGFQDVLKAFRSTLMIIFEYMFRFQEISQAQTLLTDSQASNSFRAMTNVDIGLKRAQYAESQLNERERFLEKIQKDVGELRYLTNLVKKQITNQDDECEECPVCQSEIYSFMVYTCGHRVCQDCFERLKRLNRNEILVPGWTADSIKCPSCRVRNNVQQVMLARSGYGDRNSLIPGVVLSAKLSTAIRMVRDIIDADESNKIILFTSVEPSSTAIWSYLQKILTLAKLPFSATSRSNCGKKIMDFEVSENVKVLLCSLSLCANGLNMTGANHIIFLDPPHLQSVLNQAIGRINRFGQKRSMLVFHLVVEGSLDAELREMAKKNNQKEDEKKGWTIGDIRGMFDIQNTPREVEYVEPLPVEEAPNRLLFPPVELPQN